MAVYTLLGSGTLIPDDRRQSAAHWVEDGDLRLLLDCGPGTLHGFSRHRVDWTELSHLAVSHYHTDHVGDLPAIMFALKWALRPARTEPLVMIGPAGFAGYLDRLAGAVGAHVLDPGFEVRVVELAPGREIGLGEGNARLSCHPTHHTPESVAYRLVAGEGSLGYTRDTGPTEGLADFLAGCDVLVAECSLTDPPTMDTHLSPRRLADLARRAGPDTLVVTHVYPPVTGDEAAGRVQAGGFAGRVLVGEDGLRLAFGSG